ncbi:MAG: 50S ribosomal protein L25 [Spirochaetaceae bacterium]|jgi:large subunit ribosomal protein L25|nr:50S ribosomal protein L25 [Spirochaetaceae bacterium]
MNQVVFAAQNRADTGSGRAGRIRRSGRIPAVMYGHSGTSVALDLDAQEFVSGIKGISESTIVRLEIDGKIHEAFVKDTQRNILDGKILHVDFYEIDQNTQVRARVPVHLTGNAIGVREGGILEFPLHEVELECLPRYLPESVSVDVSELKVNQSIHVRDIVFAEGIRVLSNGDQVVALVKFAKAEAAPAEEAAAPAEGTAAPAEGAAPAAAAAPGKAAAAAKEQK